MLEKRHKRLTRAATKSYVADARPQAVSKPRPAQANKTPPDLALQGGECQGMQH